MLALDTSHTACVDAWMERVTQGRSSEGLTQAFERAFSGICRRARQTLGDVTLTAIVDRVLHVAADRHPFLAGFKVTAGGLKSRPLNARARRLPPDDLRKAIRFVLCELLSVLGNLTAEILTPALHQELAKERAQVAPARQKSLRRRGPKASPEKSGGPGEDERP